MLRPGSRCRASLSETLIQDRPINEPFLALWNRWHAGLSVPFFGRKSLHLHPRKLFLPPLNEKLDIIYNYSIKRCREQRGPKRSEASWIAPCKPKWGWREIDWQSKLALAEVVTEFLVDAYAFSSNGRSLRLFVLQTSRAFLSPSPLITASPSFSSFFWNNS